MKRKRFRLYLETSVWMRLAADSTDPRRKVSFRFLRSLQGRHRIMVSSLVREEIRRVLASSAKRSLVRRFRRYRCRPLPETRAVRRLALELLREGGWSTDKVEDMTHLSFAMLNGVDALVSWDVRDLARPRTRMIAARCGHRHNLKLPLIGTPPEIARCLGLPTP